MSVPAVLHITAVAMDSAVTLMVDSVAPVVMVLQEMDTSALVRIGIFWDQHLHCHISDIDECSSGDNNCHEHANCTNTLSSHTCSCRHGYTGNGAECTGKEMIGDIQQAKHRYRDNRQMLP